MKVPWFLGAPAFIVAVVVAGVVSNYLGADYFKRTRLDEANPLAAAPGGSGAAGGTEVVAGRFRDGEPGHRGSGSARIVRAIDGTLTLRLEQFSVTNGPDLFVVLSPSADGYADGSLNLGALKATDGNFNYTIPMGTDIAQFRSVVVWCRQFDVTFALAGLGGDGKDAAPMTAVAAQVTPETSPTTGQAGANLSPAPTATAIATQAPAPPTATATATVDRPAGPVVLAKGAFRDGEPGHRGSGAATLGRDATGKPVVVFENFSVTNGPDLHVILSSDPKGSGQGIDLGKLKATDGTFSYEIPAATDLSQVRSVTIWCASFPTVFAVATLEAA